MTAAFRKELKRKIFHFFSLLYAGLYAVVGRSGSMKILLPLLAVESAIEFGRFLRPDLNAALLRGFGGIHREAEERRVSGIFWTLLGCALTMALFTTRRVVLCALGQLALGDGLAGLVGVGLGRHRIAPGKTLEGSLACFAASFAVGSFFFGPAAGAASALFVTIVELLPLPYNDNLWIPVLAGAFLSFISNSGLRLRFR